MAIVINGSGTVTGISAGGLPDGVVDLDTLAANSVNAAKIVDGTIVVGDIADDAVTADKLANSINTDIATGVAALSRAGGTMTGSVKGSTLTDATNTGSITLDFSASQNFVLTLTGNVTLANPSTEAVGQSGFIAFIQDGTELSSSFHRHVLAPSTKTGDTWGDTDISGEDARVQAVANATWTSAVKTAYQEQQDANELPE